MCSKRPSCCVVGCPPVFLSRKNGIFCKNCEVFAGIGVFVEEINDLNCCRRWMPSAQVVVGGQAVLGMLEVCSGCSLEARCSRCFSAEIIRI